MNYTIEVGTESLENHNPQIPLKETLAQSLRTQNLRVVFKKTNGDIRVMRCTTNPESVPETSQSGSSRKKNDDVFTVYDIEKSAWRSFRYSSLQSVEPDSLDVVK